MSTLNLLFTFSNRQDLPDFMEVLQRNSVDISQIILASGTHHKYYEDILGIGSDKSVTLSVVTDEVWLKIKNDLENLYGIFAPGKGAACIIPLSSFGGAREFAYYTDGQNYQKGEVSTMKDTEVEMIVVISNQGHNNEVMEAAKAGGAGGGTVIHAAGTGVKKAEAFFGVTLATEKEITIIVTKSEFRNSIMESIMKNVGIETSAKSVAFSLPVSGTAGFKHLG